MNFFPAGIVKNSGNEMILCLSGDPDGERPKEFEKATKENGLMVFTLAHARKVAE